MCHETIDDYRIGAVERCGDRSGADSPGSPALQLPAASAAVGGAPVLDRALVLQAARTRSAARSTAGA